MKEEADEYQSQGMIVINKGVTQMLKQRRLKPQLDYKNNEYQRNYDRCYNFGKDGHIKKNGPE